MKKDNTRQLAFQATKNRLRAYINYVLVAFVLFLIVSLTRNILEYHSSISKIDKEIKEVDNLKKINEDLKKNLDKITSSDFIEKQIRDQLGLSKQGEIVLVLPDSEELKKLVPKFPEDPQELPDPNWKKWLKLFL